MAKVNDWNFFDQNVQSGLLEGRFMNAAFTMLAAGPPRLSAVAGGQGQGEALGDIAFPIGVLQSVNLSVNSQWMRLWEIGSERSYYVRGRTQGQVSLGRIMYHGPSLLKVLYAYLQTGFGSVDDKLYANSANAHLNTSGQSSVGANVQGTKTDGTAGFKLPPGYDNIWMDLASDVFSQPIGLLLYMRDSNEDTVGAFYLEYCVITNYGWATDAGGTILTENAAILYERMVPIDIKAVSLIKNSTSIEGIVGGTVIGSAAGPGDLQP
jgi:hypothetical protein